jgi:hypothetical protein
MAFNHALGRLGPGVELLHFDGSELTQRDGMSKVRIPFERFLHPTREKMACASAALQVQTITRRPPEHRHKQGEARVPAGGGERVGEGRTHKRLGQFLADQVAGSVRLAQEAQERALVFETDHIDLVLKLVAI